VALFGSKSGLEELRTVHMSARGADWLADVWARGECMWNATVGGGAPRGLSAGWPRWVLRNAALRLRVVICSLGVCYEAVMTALARRMANSRHKYCGDGYELCMMYTKFTHCFRQCELSNMHSANLITIDFE
jgi:hypothetical protein